MAEQIANQLQRKEHPKTLLDKKKLVRYTKGAVCLDKTALVNKLLCSKQRSAIHMWPLRAMW